MAVLRIVLAQINLTVGDVDSNAERIIESIGEAKRKGAALVAFPELALIGYPPEDLLLRARVIERIEQSLDRVITAAQGIDVVVGAPLFGPRGDLFNAALWLRDGRVLARYHKQVLPNYSVFDEKRYFTAGERACVVDCHGVRIGLTICEDAWQPGPSRFAAAAKAQVLLNINASPFHFGKHEERARILHARVCETGLPMVYVNLVGGQDELVFDGESMVVHPLHGLVFRAPAFSEGIYAFDLPVGHSTWPAPALAPSLTDEGSLYQALVLGTRDYVRKNGFPGVVLGLSGGIDSALTLAIAVDALGAEQVRALMMPSIYTSQMSLDDAAAQADALGVAYGCVSITPVFEAFKTLLADEFAGYAPDATEENIQARCRGMILMAVSNKTGRMLLTTGNKSEMAVGYATLYGDMAGGFAPLKDVAKTWVYRLARYRNEMAPVIPERVLVRAPSAELAPDQKDEDSLPPYAVLDPILERFVERDWSIGKIVGDGFEADIVRRVADMVLKNEYKRRQAPPGVRVTRRAFGKDRRYPITSGYRKMLD